MMTVGERIKEQRLRNNMTMEILAKMIGVRKATVSRYESGAITVPSEKIKAIADALDVAPGYLMGWLDFPGQTSILDGIIESDYTVKPVKVDKRERLLDIVRNAPEEQLDLLIGIAEAVIKNRKG